MYNKHSTYLLPDQVDIHQDPEFAEYGYKHKRTEIFEVEVIGFCEMCNKRISTPDDVHINKFNIFCSEACSNKLDEMESEHYEQQN